MGNFHLRRSMVPGACLSLFAALMLGAAGGSTTTAGAAGAAVTATGLVAAYSFDEGSGTTAADASGNGNTGSVSGAAWTTSGRNGGALSFSGAGNVVTVADAASLDLASAATVEAWVYQTAGAASQGIIAKERAGGGLPYGVETNGGVPGGYVTSGSHASAWGTTALAANAWTHVGMTYDGANVRLYLNGGLVATRPQTGALTASSGALSIGGSATWGEWFRGRIDDVRVYSRPLTAAEVQTDLTQPVVSAKPPPASSLVGAWSFDAGSGTTATDSSGRGNNGTLNGATWQTSGRFGGAISFNGAGGNVSVPDNASLDLTNASTLEAWIYPTSAPAFAAVVAKERTGGGLPYGLESASGVSDAYVNTGGNATARSSSALPVSSWTHLAQTYDGAAVRLYVNGALAASTPATGSLLNSTDPLRIGGDQTWGEWFAGRIDEVRIYSRALSQGEIQADMNTSIGGGSPPPPPPPGDTQAPTTPSGLTVTAKTQTSVTLAWNASSDNVGVAGYGVYNGATRTQQTSLTNATVTALSCGTTYTLGVDAYDAAGNRSTRASIGATTSACPAPPPSGTGSVFLSASGSDSNSCTQSAPCRSFDRAYHVANPGQIVEVAAGSYGSQNLTFDPANNGATSDVVFQPASGASVTVGQLSFGSTRMEAGASHVTVKNITVTGDVSIPGCGVPDNTPCPADAQSPGNDLTFQNLRVKGPYAFYCASCSNVSIIGGTWGPDTYQCRSGLGSAHPEVQSAYTQVKRAHGILIDGATWQNFARCTSGDHTECLQVEPADDMTVRNSTFKMCDTIVVNFANDLANSNSSAGFRAPNNILIENNFFDTSKDNTGGPTWYALNIRECSNCTIRYNSWTQAPRMPNVETHLNVKFIGNAGPFGSAGCLAGVVFAYNVWEGASCSSTDKNVGNAGFTNRGAVDLHLTSSSPAINAGDPSTFPAADIDGQARPLGGRADAGADERQ
jgi:concanavalin A-like lectin/glucanase superfamily protein/fibronectin type III domain protein